MGTLSSTIFDFFLTNVNDYRLTNIYTTSGSLVLDIYLEPFLLNSIVEFYECNQDLSYTVAGSTIEGSFDVDLSTENQLMLSHIMMRYYMGKEVADILQLRNALQDRDFKTYSQANNLKEKRDYYNSIKEDISQRLNDYSYRKNNWDSWRNQIFYS